MRTALLVLALPALLSAGDFWKEKSPADWTEKEARRMTRNSPWAHEATPKMEGMMGGALPSGGRGGRGGRGGGAMGGAESGGDFGSGMGGDAGGGGNMGGAGGRAPIPNVYIRWESATPVREAFTKLDVANPYPKELAEKTAAFYVITVEGMRMQVSRPRGGQPGQQRPQGDQQQLTQEDLKRMQDRMGQSATLIRKDKEPMRPEGVRLMPGERGPTYQLYFKKTDPITQDEKEVKFVVKMGPMTVETKFKPKDMVFAGLLAL
jgi:hypothetical protein